MFSNNEISKKAKIAIAAKAIPAITVILRSDFFCECTFMDLSFKLVFVYGNLNEQKATNSENSMKGLFLSGTVWKMKE
jgi:hypothetical protein